MGASSPEAEQAIGAVKDEDLARILRAANPLVLRATLFQLTGSPELQAMRTLSSPIRGGASWETVLDPRHVDDLVEFGVRYLRAPTEKAPDFTADKLAEIIPLLTGEDPSDDELAMYLDELGFAEFPRGVEWPDGSPPRQVDDYHVTIVGAGVSGLALAVLLRRMGIKFTILERGKGVGGVWETNSYPEARVDVHSLLYQYKFVKDHRWKEWFASRDAVLAYHNDVADRYELRANVELHTELKSAVWDATDCLWHLEIEGHRGTEKRVTNFIVSASGLFAKKSIPSIPGIEGYEGEIFHTTAWNHEYNFTGKSAGLIGNGSTGTQLMPNIAKQVTSMTVFQRSPNWIADNPLYRQPVPDEVLWLYDHLPGYWNWACLATYVVAARNQWSHTVDPEWIAAGGQISERNDALRRWLTDDLQKRFEDRPDLFEATLPSYAPGAKRIIVHNGWYDALREPHVALVTESIEAFTKSGIRTADGRHYPLDAVILASGFAVSEYFWPVNYVGRDGVDLEQAWAKDGARAYLGMTIPNFPNFFSMYGPNSQPRAGGFHQWAESWARYITRAIAHVISANKRTIEPRAEMYDHYNQVVDEEFAKTIWSTGAGGYYINEHGRPGVHIPFTNEKFYSMIRNIDIDDYTVG